MSAVLTRIARTGLFDESALGRTPGYAEFAKMVGTHAAPPTAESATPAATRVGRARRPRSGA